MWTESVIRWTAIAVGFLVTMTAAYAMVRNAPHGPRDYTDVGGVTIDVPGDTESLDTAAAGTDADGWENTDTPPKSYDSSKARKSGSTSGTTTQTSGLIAGTTTGTSATSTTTTTTTDGSTTVRTAASKDPAPTKQPGGGGKTKPGGGDTGSAIEARGSVSGLYPGHRRYLPLKLENKNNFAVSVVEMTISVTSNSPCAASNISLPQAWTAQHINAKSEITVQVPIEMVASATNECAGRTFGLSYNGKAVKA